MLSAQITRGLAHVQALRSTSKGTLKQRCKPSGVPAPMRSLLPGWRRRPLTLRPPHQGEELQAAQWMDLLGLSQARKEPLQRMQHSQKRLAGRSSIRQQHPLQRNQKA